MHFIEKRSFLHGLIYAKHSGKLSWVYSLVNEDGWDKENEEIGDEKSLMLLEEDNVQEEVWEQEEYKNRIGDDGKYSDRPEDRTEIVISSAYIETVLRIMPSIVRKRKWFQLGKESSGDFDTMVGVLDEVMMLWILYCYWNSWMPFDQWKMTLEKLQKLVPSVEEYQHCHVDRSAKEPYFVRNPRTEKTGVKKKYGGITMKGKTCWNDYVGDVQRY
ncbi:hypothetical protein ACA910_017135 [Epithemia clementina (nom. ined.)]